MNVLYRILFEFTIKRYC